MLQIQQINEIQAANETSFKTKNLKAIASEKIIIFPTKNKKKPLVGKTVQSKIPFQLLLDKVRVTSQNKEETGKNQVMQNQNFQRSSTRQARSVSPCLPKNLPFLINTRIERKRTEVSNAALLSQNLSTDSDFKQKTLSRMRINSHEDLVSYTSRPSKQVALPAQLERRLRISSWSNKLNHKSPSPMLRQRLSPELITNQERFEKQPELKISKELSKLENKMKKTTSQKLKQLQVQYSKQFSGQIQANDKLLKVVPDNTQKVNRKNQILQMFNCNNRKQFNTLKKIVKSKFQEKKFSLINPEGTISSLLNFKNEEVLLKQDTVLDKEDVQDFQDICQALQFNKF